MRTALDPLLLGPVALVPLVAQRGTAIVDAADLPRIIGRSWRASGNGYAKTGAAGPFMHRLILDAPTNLSVDHINGNGLDNRRSNLRLCNAHQNGGNRSAGRMNRSGFKGVGLHKQSGRWRAYMGDGNSGYRHLGMFDDAESAARAYDTAALEWFGEFARLNFPAEVAS